MSRIASLSSSNELVRLLLQTQSRLQDAQIQVSTEQKSQTYLGITRDSERLIDLELRKSLLDRFIDVNDVADARLSATEANLDGIEDTIRVFREEMFLYEAGSLDDQDRIQDMQEAAFRALVDIESFLNADVFGEFVFAGGRTDRKPVDLDLTTLAAFQAKYDGSVITYPTGRDNHIQHRLTAATGLPTNPTGAGFGTVTFAGGLGGTITAATAGSFANIPVGDTITIAGSASNNLTFTVTANTGTVITVGAAETVTAEAATAAPTIAADTRYYSGDNLTRTHRTEATRDFNVNVTGIDPAFEKAIRAMGHMAQGAFGTAGGLDQVANQGRVIESLFFVNSALLPPPTQGIAPFGVEQVNNMQDVLQDVAYDRVLMNDTIARQKELISFINARISKAENIDPTEAVTRLLDQQRNLEASFQSFARIRALSLGDFLR
jgi:flagellar hook-associated protein 3 FlgL